MPGKNGQKPKESRVGSFQEVAQIFEGLDLSVPDIPPELLEDPSRFDEVVKKMAAACTKIQEGVSTALRVLETFLVWIAAYTTPLEIKIARRQIGQQETRAREYLKDRLGAKDPIYQGIAAKTVFQYFFQKPVNSLDEAIVFAKQLQSYSLLVEDQVGPIYIGYNHYRISNEFNLDEDDRQEIGTAYERFWDNVQKLEKQRRMEVKTTLEEQATPGFTFDDFTDGKIGKFLLKVPPEKFGDGPNDWRSGGHILLENRQFGKDVYTIPWGASGKIEKDIADMNRRGVKLLFDCLKDENPPGGESLQRRISTEFVLSEEKTFTHIGKMIKLWWLIQRGWDDADAQAENAEDRERFKALAPIEPEDFLGLRQELLPPGASWLEFEGAYQIKKGETTYKVFGMGLLVERTIEEDQTTKLAVLEATKSTIEYLGESLNMIHEEGDKFERCEHRLGKLLRAIRSQVEKRLSLAENTEGEAESNDSDTEPAPESEPAK